jgi:hypothetical protein
VIKHQIKLLNFRGYASTFALSKNMKLDAIEELAFYNRSNMTNNRMPPNTSTTISNITKCGTVLKSLYLSGCSAVRDILSEKSWRAVRF